MEKLFTKNVKPRYRVCNTASFVWFLFVCCLLSSSLYAQSQSNVSGTVKDETGMPLAGVTVMEKNTNNGVVTDFDGNYNISIVKDKAVLVFNYMGFVPQEVNFKGESKINITLKEDLALLDEVVVVGYGKQKKSNLTSAVSVISSDVISDRSSTNLTSALQGAAPGLSISKSTGQPGEEGLSIQIRGLSSANGNVNPLVIIDGVPSTTAALNQTINPQDVESVTVLKDAAAASIYGSQAAGGVILVTTKSGKSGKTKISYSGQTSLSWARNMPARLSLLDEANYSNLARKNAGVGPEYNEKDLENIKNNVPYIVSENNPNQYIYYNQEDIRDVLLRDVSVQQNHNFSASGGSEKTTYLFSLGYLGQEGVFRVGPDNFKRYTSRLNLNSELTKHVFLDSKISYAVHNREQPSQGTDGYSLFQQLSQTRIRYPLFTPEGRISGGGTDIYGILTEGGYTNKGINDLDANLTVTVKNFVEGLQFRAIYGRGFKYFDSKNFKRKVTQWGRLEPMAYLNNPNSLTIYKESIERQNFQFLTDYDLTLGDKHNFHVLAGFQWEDYRLDGLSGFASSLVSNDLPALNIGSRDSYNNTQSINTYASQSAFGRLSYNFDGKYLVEATIRLDETSRLAPGSRSELFPSISLGWNLHKEEWFANALPFVSQLKPRYSWGQLGNANANIIGNYDYLPTLSTGSNLVLGNSEDRSTYFYQNGVPSSTLAWETVETSNFGLDVDLFNYKFQASFDYYTKQNKNMLIPLDLPATFGVNAPRVNNGELKSWGWELEVQYKDKIGKDLSYNVGFNLSDNQNELVDYGGGRNIVRSGTNSFIQGYPINTVWGYKTKTGYIQSQEQLDGAPKYSNNTGIGDIEYIDQNGDGLINAGKGTTDDPGDLVQLGTTNPRYLFGLTAGAKWKNLDFNLFLQGVSQRNFMPNTESIMPYAQTWFSAQKHHEDYWTAENPNAAFPRPYLKGTHNYASSDRWVLNGNYIRLKNVQLGYSLTQEALGQIGLKAMRLYVMAQDILTFSKLGVFKGVFDPEQNNGVRADYPVFATVSFGMNISF